MKGSTRDEREPLNREPKLQKVSYSTWKSKYQLKGPDGRTLDKTPDDTLKRVARALAQGEKKPEFWEKEFLQALQWGALPGGRILANAGVGELKSGASLINCTVAASSGPEDSIDSIGAGVHSASITLAAGCGIGYEFSKLRPKGAFVQGVGASTSGPLPFMQIYDSMCKTIASAGGRRGAQMATFDVSHPDIFNFIRAKRTDGRLRQFNLSCLITREFVEAVQRDQEWPLVFPLHPHETVAGDEIVYKNFPTTDGYTTNAEGKVACKVYRRIQARSLWLEIMRSNYDFAEPGFILIDRVNELNNLWFCENIRATNPFGEQPLPEDASCLLGSINLVKFVDNPFTKQATFNWVKFESVVAVFTRMLDNVVELANLPHQTQQGELLRTRRHGMGFTALGSALALLGLRYGEEKALEFTHEVSRRMALVGWRVGGELAVEKGSAPILQESFLVSPAMYALRPDFFIEQGIEVGDTVPGLLLWLSGSKYLQKLPSELRETLGKHGCRFTHHSSIAPTGTISLAMGNNVSSGIEPSFSHKYTRNLTVEGRVTREPTVVYSYESLVYQELYPESRERGLPEEFVDSSDISPQEHLKMQAAAQEWVDSSISKTISVPPDITFADFEDIYMTGIDLGLKGCTTFRYNPKNFQGILTKETDTSKSLYKFTTSKGEEITVAGDTHVRYQGEVTTGANLYDALKEGI